MKHWPIILLCAAALPGCVSVNGGNRPMGSIVGQNETTPSVPEQLAKAMPGPQWLARR